MAGKFGLIEALKKKGLKFKGEKKRDKRGANVRGTKIPTKKK